MPSARACARSKASAESPAGRLRIDPSLSAMNLSIVG
jgi:hypothetical protein